MTSRWWLSLAALFVASSLYAQFDTEGAQVISYFPHLADGGSASQRWVTTLTFVNSHFSYPAAGQVFLYGDTGGPLALDFGNGPVSSFSFTVPPQGTVTFTSTAASATIVTGWATVISTLPLQGVVQFRFSVNGVPQQGISAQATAASGIFRSPATLSTGIAIANIYSVPVPLVAIALDASGKTLATSPLTLGALAHQSFTVGQLFPSLPASFRGTVLIETTAVGTPYTTAWTVSGDAGVLSSYPPSGTGWPVSQSERIWKVWEKVLNAAVNNFPIGTPPTLVIDTTTGQINSFADPKNNQVHIFLNLAELISDSESELGFVVGHEIGHIVQARVGKLTFVPTNIEQDADEYGMLLSLTAGYDPYGAAGALAKLAMASGDASLLSQAFDNISLAVGTDLHGSFDNRLALIFQEMQQVCALPQIQSFCSLYKSVIHPHLPSPAPLFRTGD